MTTSPTPDSLRERVGSLLNDNRIVVLFELLIVTVLIFLPLSLTALTLIFFGWLSLWLRQSGWRQIGMSRPANWVRTILVGIGAAVVYQVFSIQFLVPLLQNMTGESLDLSHLTDVEGSVSRLVVSLIVSWTLAAFVEEMVYRGYLLNRLADLFGRVKSGWIIGLIVSSLFFGYAHFASQGIVGFLETTLFGLVAAGLYVVSGRNLWLPVLFHGVADTIFFAVAYLGVYP